MGIVPVPDRLTVLGLFTALVEICSVAVREPVEPGVNATSMAQLPLGAMVEPHELVWAKSPALPAASILKIVP